MFRVNVCNPYSRLKKHSHSNRLDTHKTKRYKLYWSSSGPSSGTYVRFTMKPREAGQTLYIAVGAGGTYSYSAGFVAPAYPGRASGVGDDPAWSSNIMVSPQGGTNALGTAFNSGVVGQWSAAYIQSHDTDKWQNLTILDNIGYNGVWTDVYDSWNPLTTSPTISAYTGTTTGPGASEYNTNLGNRTFNITPGYGGYVRVKIV